MLYNILFPIFLLGLTFFILLLFIFPYLGIAILWLILVLIPMILILYLAAHAIRFFFESIGWIIRTIIWLFERLWVRATGSEEMPEEIHEERKETEFMIGGNSMRGSRVTTRKDKMGKKVTWSSEREELDESGTKWTKVSEDEREWDDWI